MYIIFVITQEMVPVQTSCANQLLHAIMGLCIVAAVHANSKRFAWLYLELDLSAVKVIVASTDDYDSLVNMAAKAMVILNCVGPVSLLHSLFIFLFTNRNTQLFVVLLGIFVANQHFSDSNKAIIKLEFFSNAD